MNLLPTRDQGRACEPILRRLGRRMKRILRPGALILGYHRVIELPSDPYSMCVPPQIFAGHLEVIRKYAKPISLKRLIANLRAGRLEPRSVVITFDDGYFDALANARPLLDRYGLPATLFAISGFIGSPQELWWDELEQIIGDAAKPEFDKVYEEALGMSAVDREQMLTGLCRNARGKVSQRDAYRGLTPEELLRLADGGLVEVGAHTVTHPSLPKLGRTVQRNEIRNSRAQLESILGSPVTSFSYPHGQAGEYAMAEVQAAGFHCACSSVVDLARPSSPLYRLPRVQVRPWSADEFHQRLHFWFEG